MTMEEVLSQMANELIVKVSEAYEHQRAFEIFAPLHFSLERVSDGGNAFEIEIRFKPCFQAMAQPSKN